ncbi:V-type proton ATPase subunit S1-like [Eriocheir sinensis]|uniref:V-type proton ATPase subunit S1-like n=1 Tax=Eriocheir sinensis TaxID=95602 RepID=UPI0021C62CBB|nr:V-type proton ATPase subunit S1-like [Eriocheir sinensis]
MEGRAVILLLCSLFCGVLAKDHVPVLIWNPSQNQESVRAVSALQTLDYATFQSKYLSEFQPKNVLLFIQDALSVEDLSSHTTEFQPLKKWMTNSHYLYLPKVEDPAHLAHDLPSRGYNVVTLEPGVPAAGLDLKQQDNNLVVVKLPSTLTNPSRSHALQKAVEVMQNVISKVGAKREFTFIFTGLKPSVEDNSEKYEERLRVRRAAGQIPQERGFHSESCVMLYFKMNFTLTIMDNTTEGQIVEVIDDQPSTDTGHCDDPSTPDRTAQINMKFTGHMEHFTKLILTFNFKATSSSWSFTDVDVLLNNSAKQYNLGVVSPAITGIPIGMSYSCSENIYISTNGSTPGKMMIVSMAGVQMEAFHDSAAGNSTFGPAWDCVGFFTVPIWVSLLTTLLLLIILTTGLYMLSDIKTMDRFDDPKGQPIMIPVSD